MSITRENPNKILLGGDYALVNDLAASESITPGHLIDSFNSGGVNALFPNTSDPLIDGREEEGVSQLIGSDVNSLIVVLLGVGLLAMTVMQMIALIRFVGWVLAP